MLQLLNFLSSLSTIDGVYGPDARRAISEWQISKGLIATGILSDQHAQLLERTPYEQAAAQAAEQQRQEAAAKECERISMATWRTQRKASLVLALPLCPSMRGAISRCRDGRTFF